MNLDAASAYRIEPLSDSHDRSIFECGVEGLNRYLREQAGQDGRRRVAVFFLLVTRETGIVVGFYTLASTGVELQSLPQSVVRKLPKYPLVPATLLGRLAVDVRHRRLGLGEFLLLDALHRSLEASQRVASFAVIVDAKDESARQFYLKFGFVPLPDSPRRLFLPMATAGSLPGI